MTSRNLIPFIGKGGLSAIFGSNLLEVWDASSGVTLAVDKVTSWKGIMLGRDLTPPTTGQRPTLAVDTGYFLDKPVIQFSATTGLSNTAVGLGTDSDSMGLLMVARFRTLPTPVDANPFRYLVACIGNRIGPNATGQLRIYLRMQTDSTRGWSAYARVVKPDLSADTHSWLNGSLYNINPAVVHVPTWPGTGAGFSFGARVYNTAIATVHFGATAIGWNTGGFKEVHIGNTANGGPADCVDFNVATLAVFKSYTETDYLTLRDRLHDAMRLQWGTT